MHVLYFLKRFPKLSESFVLNEIDELTRRGHTVAVFARQKPDETVHHDEYSDLDVRIRYAKRTTLADAPDLLAPEVLNQRVLRQCFYYEHPKQHAKLLHLAKQCITFIHDLDWSVDHIHAHFAYPSKIAATYAAAYFNISCTVTAHAYELFADADPHALRVLFDRTNRAIVPSRYNRWFLRECFDIEGPIDVVPATTRLSKFESTDQEVPNRLLTVARLVEKKGIVYGIEALARLHETFPSIEYHIVGTGERESVLRRRAAKLGIGKYVIFLGNVSDERLRQELDEAAVFVLPSVIAADGDRDGSPVALKEAMAMAIPCISTAVTGIPEIIENGVDGLLVEPRNSDALAATIATILTDDSKRHTMGRRARETVTTKFSLEAAVNGLLASFQAAIEEQERDRRNQTWLHVKP